MKTIIKRRLWIMPLAAILLLMVSPLALAVDQKAVPEKQATPVKEDANLQPLELTLEKALAIGLEKNDKINLSLMSVDAAKINLDQIQSAAKKMQKTIDDNKLSLSEDMDKAINVLPAQVEENYKFSLISRDYTKNAVMFEIQSNYYGLQKAEKALEVAKLSMKRSQTQYKNAIAKEKQGVISKMDVVNAEAGYHSAQATYEQTRDSVIYARMNINKVLGQNINTTLILKDKITFSPRKAIDLLQVLESAKKTDASVASMLMQYNIGQINKKFDQSYSYPYTYRYQQADIQFLQAKRNYDESLINLEINIKNSYNKLNTAMDNYNSLIKSRDLAKEGLRLSQLRYDNGLATIYDVQNADLAYQQAEIGLLDAIHNYNLAYSAFDYGVFSFSM